MKQLLILEQDVGLFCLVGQIVNMMEIIEINNLNITPIALFGRRCMYFHDEGWRNRRNVWEYYFEPLHSGYGEAYLFEKIGDDLMDIAESLCKKAEYERGVKHGWQDKIKFKLSQKDLENCARFKNFLYSDDHDSFDNYKASYDFTTRHHNIKKIRLRSYLRKTIEEFYSNNLENSFVIGVHVRGTDGYGGKARTGKEIDIQGYFNTIRNALSKHESVKIFVASDEEKYVNIFKNEFGDKVVDYPAYRKSEDDHKIFGKGPTGQAMPAYITKSRKTAIQNGEDAIVEYALLCKSNLFLHNSSGLSKMVRITCHPHLQSHGF